MVAAALLDAGAWLAEGDSGHRGKTEHQEAAENGQCEANHELILHATPPVEHLAKGSIAEIAEEPRAAEAAPFDGSCRFEGLAVCVVPFCVSG